MRCLPLLLLLLALPLPSPLRADAPPGPFPASVTAWTPDEKTRQEQAAVQLQKDILAAIARGDHTFTVPPGDYRFDPRDPGALPQLKLHAVSDFTIDAAGATFWFYPFQRLDGLNLDQCQGVTVRGLTIDYHITPYPQGVICGLDAKAGSIDFQLEVDAVIEKQEGMPIGEIFIAKGEAYFRRAEREIIAQLIHQPPAILSLGGGAFMWEATRELLLAQTVVFYLSATVEVICARLQARGGTATRPLLSTPGIDLPQTITELLERRGAYYGMAHYRVETDFHSPDDVAKAVLSLREAYE